VTWQVTSTAQHMSKWPNSEWDTKLGLISAQD